MPFVWTFFLAGVVAGILLTILVIAWLVNRYWDLLV